MAGTKFLIDAEVEDMSAKKFGEKIAKNIKDSIGKIMSSIKMPREFQAFVGQIIPTQAIAGKATGSKASGGATMMGMSAALSGIAAALVAILSILTAASEMLQKTLGGIWKAILLLFRPIGDLLAVGLMPLIYMIMPMAKFFSMLMRPYIMEARKAMAAGAIFQSQGNNVMALEMYTLGVSWVLKPIMDMMILAIGVVGQVIITTLLKPLDILVTMLKILGDVFIWIAYALAPDKWIDPIAEAWDNLKSVIGSSEKAVSSGWWTLINAAISGTNKFLADGTDAWLEYAKTQKQLAQDTADYAAQAREAATGKKSDSGKSSSGSYGQVTTGIINRIIAGGPSAGEQETQSIANQLLKDLYPNLSFNDFIWRAGQRPIAISSDDNIVGTKGSSTGGININVNAQVTASSSEIKKIAEEIAQLTKSEIRRRVSY